MIVAIADTHAIVWYLANDKRLSNSAKIFIESTAKNGDEIGISGITLVEMVFLIERGRIPSYQFSELAKYLNKIDSLIVQVPVDLDIARILTQIDSSQIPEMPDRIIAATGLKLNVPIISRDTKIQLSTIQTIW